MNCYLSVETLLIASVKCPDLHLSIGRQEPINYGLLRKIKRPLFLLFSAEVYCFYSITYCFVLQSQTSTGTLRAGPIFGGKSFFFGQ